LTVNSIVAVGSLAFDSIQTPFGRADRALGGSANYFSLAASFFAEVRCVGVVGEDYPEDALGALRSRAIRIDGVQRARGRTFHWAGRYGDDLNEAQTLDTQLNVFETFHPTIPESYRDSRFLFLGNIHPNLQRSVLEQLPGRHFVALDTMNYWIGGTRAELLDVIGRVQAVVINESEIRQLSGQRGIVAAADWLLERGPRVVVVKRGEYGAFLRLGDQAFAVPALPLRTVLDPTGAGDSFAGGFMGYLAQQGGDPTFEDLKRAVVLGSIMASLTVEQFSFDGLLQGTGAEIRRRYEQFYQLTQLPTYLPPARA
jgi:sugar/nucleoside kinase (ribokinase family)